MDFERALQSLYEEHFNRLVASRGEVYKDTAEARLEEFNLSWGQVSARCAQELASVINKKYDVQISTRLQGFGWAQAHIADHMRRFLQHRLLEVSDVLATLQSPVPAKSSMLENVDTMNRMLASALEDMDDV